MPGSPRVVLLPLEFGSGPLHSLRETAKLWLGEALDIDVANQFNDTAE